MAVNPNNPPTSPDGLLKLAERCEQAAIEQTEYALAPEVPWDDADSYIYCAVKLFKIAAALKARASQ